MIHVVADLRATPGNREKLVEAFKALLPEVYAEEGCIYYEPATGVSAGLDPEPDVDEDVVTMIERWESVEHLKVHLDAPHMHAFREKNAGLIAGIVVRVLEAR